MSCEPLFNVSGYAELLLQKNDLAKGDQEILGAIHSNSRHVVDLLDSMLDLANSDAEEAPQIEACSPHAIAQDVIRSFSVQASAKGLGLEFRPRKRLPREVIVDEIRLRRILINLVSNAIKYSSTGTVSITADLRQRPGKPKNDHPWIVWKVQDRGPGISPEDISRLCLPYYRGKAAKSSLTSGSGLGLFITKQLVEALGGELTVVSSVGWGTTFIVGLPVRMPLTTAEPRH